MIQIQIQIRIYMWEGDTAMLPPVPTPLCFQPSNHLPTNQNQPTNQPINQLPTNQNQPECCLAGQAYGLLGESKGARIAHWCVRVMVAHF